MLMMSEKKPPDKTKDIFKKLKPVSIIKMVTGIDPLFQKKKINLFGGTHFKLCYIFKDFDWDIEELFEKAITRIRDLKTPFEI
ncbi:hypothetical protein AYI68_g3651 [Smittium mucronatum]|uniref:Uncharacterized protein n=1 Tax=Smittium mucronatum TaxID=133383 RepID=A0A1R0GZC1_9FUNG|nr:hypothetical protein AYI68_g3651 [Smittium mucronatum]